MKLITALLSLGLFVSCGENEGSFSTAGSLTAESIEALKSGEEIPLEKESDEESETAGTSEQEATEPSSEEKTDPFNIPGVAQIIETPTALPESVIQALNQPDAPKLIIEINNTETPLGNTVEARAYVEVDGIKQDVTNDVKWSTDDDSVVAPGEFAGNFDTVSQGTATITAAYDGSLPQATDAISAQAEITVAAPELTQISITPKSSTIPAGDKISYNVQGTYTDGSVQDLTAMASFSSSDESVARLSSTPGVIETLKDSNFS